MAVGAVLSPDDDDSTPVLTKPRRRKVRRTTPLPESGDLARCHSAFHRWLGPTYDLRALDCVLASAAVQKLDGDPVWLMLIGGPGSAKTETLMALQGGGARVVSSIASEGALLSATPARERANGAGGGLLRELGDNGLLVLKDFTTVLSMNSNVRSAVLAALREIYDGQWARSVGTDGGQSLEWRGRLNLLGAVTTAYDSAHQVIATMGERFALLRLDTTARQDRLAAGSRALDNVGHEQDMRRDLADAVAKSLDAFVLERAVLDNDARSQLLDAAELVTRLRTATERDGRGELVSVHGMEAATRFAKMLAQLSRAARGLGIRGEVVADLAARVARDTVPPMRLEVLRDIWAHENTSPLEVARRLDKPATGIRRVVEDLHAIEAISDASKSGRALYRVSTDVDLRVLNLVP